MKRKFAVLAAAALFLAACSNTDNSSVSGTETQTSAEIQTSAGIVITEKTSAPTETATAGDTSAAAETEAEIKPEAPEDPSRPKPPDLKTLGFYTDYYALTNAEKYSLDEDVSVDLDGDGKNEIINFSHKVPWEYDEEVLLRVPYINGEEAELTFSDTMREMYGDDLTKSFTFFHPSSSYFYICDADSSDKYKEIAFVTEPAECDDFYTALLRWENGSLKYLYELMYDTPDPRTETLDREWSIGMNITAGNPIIFDGSGTITSSVRLYGSQTWFGYMHYKYDSETGNITPVWNEPVYPYSYENINSFSVIREITDVWYGLREEGENGLFLNKAVAAFEEPSLDSPSITIGPQRVFITAEIDTDGSYDAEYWEYLIAQDGSKGWIHTDERRYEINSDGSFKYLGGGKILLADGSRADMYDVFSGLIQYD